jgi:hypothetical protein
MASVADDTEWSRAQPLFSMVAITGHSELICECAKADCTELVTLNVLIRPSTQPFRAG